MDVDPVLRQFGSRREIAQRHFIEYVGAGCDDDGDEYSSAENDILGSGEFVDAAIHRVGDVSQRTSVTKEVQAFDADSLISAVETVFGLSREDFLEREKTSAS